MGIAVHLDVASPSVREQGAVLCALLAMCSLFQNSRAEEQKDG